MSAPAGVISIDRLADGPGVLTSVVTLLTPQVTFSQDASMSRLISILFHLLTLCYLSSAVDIQGRIVNSDLTPLPNIEVLLNTDHRALTHQDGQFIFYNVSQGEFF